VEASARRSRFRFAVLSALYVAQGMPHGFVGWVLIPTLAANGVSLEDQTGLIAMAGLPWVLKALWGPLLDRGKRPRTYILVAQVLMALALVAMAATGDVVRNVALIAFIWLAHNVCMSLQDVATDALALDVIDEDERGKANAFMLGGHHIGAEIIGGLAMYWAVARWGLAAGLWGLAALLVVLTVVVFLLRVEGGGLSAARVREPFWPKLREAFSSRAAVLGLVLAPLVLFADIMTSATTGEYLVNRLGWDVAEIPQILAPYTIAITLVGFVIAFAVVDRFGHRRVAAVGTVLLGLTWAVWGLAEPLWASKLFIYAMMLVQQLATPLLLVGLHALFMDLTSPRVRATNFVIFMALLNLPRVVAPKAGAYLVAAFDFAGMFVVAGAIQVAIVVLILAVRPRSQS
jgi:PAT family beta-lactamase induction signal transducer AmpG